MHVSRKYLIVNEVFNAVTHGIGAALSIAALVLLIIKGAQTGSLSLFSYIIYGSSLLLLFLSSTLFHSLIFTRAKKVFQIFDHCSIYLLIAGSYTPFCLLVVGGTKGWLLFGALAAIAILGIVYKSIFIEKKSKLDVLIYIVMGWLCLFVVEPLVSGLGPNGFKLLLLGGLSYTIGAIFYSLQKYKYMHVIWHLFVLAGAIFIFFSVYLYT